VESISPLPELEFFFSPLCSDDLEFFNVVRNSSSEYLHDPRQFSIEQTRQWFAAGQKTSYWMVRFGNQPIGYFRTKVLGPKTWEIGADLHESFRGKGLARMMYRKFAQKVLAPNGVSMCSLRVLRSNLRAIHLYKSLGFSVALETETDFSMEITVENLSGAQPPHQDLH